MPRTSSVTTVIKTAGSLQSSKHGPLANVGFDRPQRVHMRQSDLDSACGQHALLMATIGMGLWTRRDLLTKRRNAATAIGKVWSVLEQWHFVGTRVEQLAESLDAVKAEVAHRVEEGSSYRVAHFVARHALRGRFTVLRIQGAGESLDHCVLVVGVECRHSGGRHAPVALLALDSTHERPQISVYNVRIGIAAGPRRRWAEMQCINGSTRTVSLHSALAVWMRS
jgi:hypothetical protein